MEPIYLDHAATTPIRPEVRDAMASAWSAAAGNPSSLHRWGRAARALLEEARERLAAVLGASPREVLFTGGGTEADNLAVLGRWRAARAGGATNAESVVHSAVEHKAVLGAAKMAGREGARVVVLAVDEDGRLLVDALDEGLAARPAVVSVMWANNEVGTLQPVLEVAERCRNAGVVFHTDAVQAFTRERVRVDEVPCDLLSLSAHKLGGPKGIGALYVRSGIELAPLEHGGGQERGLRPGTEDVAAAAGFALAAELTAAEREVEGPRLAALRDRLEAGLAARVSGLVVNGGGAPRLPHILNVSVPGADQEALLASLDLEGVAAASGSACQSGAVEPSHVLLAMGRHAPGEASVRFSLGRTTTEEEIEAVIELFAAVVERLRSFAGGA
ncbi:MAG TPA: cysteine desulfurase family protein [Longimicrobiales bacterium]